MGGSVSSGRNNDELVDNLVEGGIIKTKMVEQVFRAVDRGIFYLPKFKDAAYRDLAWREGLIHISAPCIYSRVMEALELESGLSFLNIGSGTGYFSTMAGLLLGPNGINHNIELHQEIIDYGKEKIKEFIKTSAHFDDFDFCIPKFINGNILNLNTTDILQYDRVYVGVGVTTEHEPFIKSLIKINGYCVMPLNDNLVKIKRVDENTWESLSLMTVSFASLVTDNVSINPTFNLPLLKPLSLQEICRYKIRQLIRQGIKKDFNDYYDVKRSISNFNKNRLDELKKKKMNSRLNESDSEETNDQCVDCPLSRFERLFTPRRNNQQRLAAASSVASERSNTYFENQLRMMIYGRLLDPTSTRAIAYTPSSTREQSTQDDANDDDDDDDDDESLDYEEYDDEEQLYDSNSNNVDDNEKSLVEKAAETTNQNNMSESNKDAIEEEDVKKSKEISIPVIETVRKSESISSSSIGESGFSENNSSSIESNSIYSSILLSDKDSDYNNACCSNSTTVKVSSTKNEADDSNTSDGCVSSVSSGKECESDELDLSKKKPLHVDEKEEEKEIFRENLLRERIMDLPLPEDVKRFLLYHRNI